MKCPAAGGRANRRARPRYCQRVALARVPWGARIIPKHVPLGIRRAGKRGAGVEPGFRVGDVSNHYKGVFLNEEKADGSGAAGSKLGGVGDQAAETRVPPPHRSGWCRDRSERGAASHGRHSQRHGKGGHHVGLQADTSPRAPSRHHLGR